MSDIPRLENEKNLRVISSLALLYIYEKLKSFKGNRDYIRIFPVAFNTLSPKYEDTVEKFMEELSKLTVKLSDMKWGGSLIIRRYFIDRVSQRIIPVKEVKKIKDKIEALSASDDPFDHQLAKQLSSELNKIKEVREIIGIRVSKNLALYAQLTQAQSDRLRELEILHGTRLPGFEPPRELVELRELKMRGEAFWITVKLYIQALMLKWWPPLLYGMRIVDDEIAFVSPHGDEFKTLAVIFELPHIYHLSTVPGKLRVGKAPEPTPFRLFIADNVEEENLRGFELPPIRIDPSKEPTANQVAIMLIEGYYIEPRKIIRLRRGHHCKLHFIDKGGKKIPWISRTIRWITECERCGTRGPDIYTYEEKKPRVKKGVICPICGRRDVIKVLYPVDVADCRTAISKLHEFVSQQYNLGEIEANLLVRRCKTCL